MKPIGQPRRGAHAVIAGAVLAVVGAMGLGARSLLAPVGSVASVGHDVRPAALPVGRAGLGVESAELRSLRNAAHLPPRNALFSRAPSDGSSYAPPMGLHRIELDATDRGVLAYVGAVAQASEGRAALALGLARSGRYDLDVPRILRAWRLPDELLAIPLTATAFANEEGGLWGLPLEVASAYGLVVRPDYDERRSVTLSTEVAAHYLSDLHERFGSWELAVAAFGTGYAALSAAVGDVPPEDLDALGSADGRAYLRAVAAVALVLANRAAFGVDGVHLDGPLLASDLEVPAGTPFAVIARAASVPPQRLRDLNPEYAGTTVPNAASAMVVHVPAESLIRTKESLLPLLYASGGQAARSAREGSSPSEPRPRASHFYRARQEEPLAELARRLGVDGRELASDNALDPAAVIHAGQLLTLPRSSDASP